MIVCPTCQHTEFEGALFCSQCGSQLIHAEVSPHQTASYKGNLEQASGLDGFRPGLQTQPVFDSTSGVALQIMSTGDLISLERSGEFTLGRISGDQPLFPDIDLTPFQGYEAGVSRMHATLRLEKGSTTITDLGSANGTRVNGYRITAHNPHPLKIGDILSLGNLKARLLIRGR